MYQGLKRSDNTLPGPVALWLNALPHGRDAALEVGEPHGIVAHAIQCIEDDDPGDKASPDASSRRILDAYLNGTTETREAIDLVLIELGGWSLPSIAEMAMSKPAFKAFKEAIARE